MGEKTYRNTETISAWIEGWKAYLLERAYTQISGFETDFYVQCIESTAADAYEVFLETDVAHNYFHQKLGMLTLEGELLRFYKLAGIHHTIRAVRRRRKELSWAEMRQALIAVYDLSSGETEMADILCQCSSLYQTGFQELIIKTTARYVFLDRTLTPFSFAFICNFWYNSYSSFMGSFTGYVPFHIRKQRASGT